MNAGDDGCAKHERADPDCVDCCPQLQGLQEGYACLGLGAPEALKAEEPGRCICGDRVLWPDGTSMPASDRSCPVHGSPEADPPSEETPNAPRDRVAIGNLAAEAPTEEPVNDRAGEMPAGSGRSISEQLAARGVSLAEPPPEEPRRRVMALLRDDSGDGNDIERRDLDAADIAEEHGFGPRDDEGPAEWADRMRTGAEAPDVPEPTPAAPNAEGYWWRRFPGGVAPVHVSDQGSLGLRWWPDSSECRVVEDDGAWLGLCLAPAALATLRGEMEETRREAHNRLRDLARMLRDGCSAPNDGPKTVEEHAAEIIAEVAAERAARKEAETALDFERQALGDSEAARKEAQRLWNWEVERANKWAAKAREAERQRDEAVLHGRMWQHERDDFRNLLFGADPTLLTREQKDTLALFDATFQMVGAPDAGRHESEPPDAPGPTASELVERFHRKARAAMHVILDEEGRSPAMPENYDEIVQQASAVLVGDWICMPDGCTWVTVDEITEGVRAVWLSDDLQDAVKVRSVMLVHAQGGFSNLLPDELVRVRRPTSEAT